MAAVRAEREAGVAREPVAGFDARAEQDDVRGDAHVAHEDVGSRVDRVDRRSEQQLDALLLQPGGDAPPDVRAEAALLRDALVRDEGDARPRGAPARRPPHSR